LPVSSKESLFVDRRTVQTRYHVQTLSSAGFGLPDLEAEPELSARESDGNILRKEKKRYDTRGGVGPLEPSFDVG
jgi:hypothetical protein